MAAMFGCLPTLGQTDLAKQWAKRAKTGREQLEWLKSDPDLDKLRPDPRFTAMVEKAERRLASGRA